MADDEQENPNVSSNKNNVLAIDVGGTKLLLAIVGQDASVHARAKLRTDTSSPQALCDQIVTAAKELLAGFDGNVLAVCAGLPGIIDPEEGTMIGGNVPLERLDMAGLLEAELGLTAIVANDVNLGVMGEATFGAGRSVETIVGIFVGTSVGGGLVLEGKPYTGSHGAAGEAGWMFVHSGESSVPLAEVAGREAIVGAISEALAEDDEHPIALRVRNGEQVRSKHVRQALADGHAPTVAAVQKAAHALGEVAAGVANLLDPDVVVIGGGLIEGCGAFIMPTLLATAQAGITAPPADGPVVVQSELGDDAVILGASVYAFEYLAGNQPDVRRRALPEVEWVGPGEVKVNGRRKVEDVVVREDGSVRKRRKKLSLKTHGSTHLISAEEVRFICKGKPRVLIVGTGTEGRVDVGDDAKEWLKKKNINLICKQSEEAVVEFGHTAEPAALLLHVRH